MGGCLVIANQTLASAELLHEVNRRIDNGQVSFYVVVPATPIVHAATWEEGESLRAAGDRLRAIVAWLHERGAEADGEIGDRDPVAAARDAIRRRPVDEIILSTFPVGRSRWIGQDVPSRLRAAVRLPVQVITPPRRQTESPAAEPDLAPDLQPSSPS